MAIEERGELPWWSIKQLSDAIHQGEISPVAVMDALQDRIAALDGELNSFRLVSRDRAMLSAEAATKALEAGIDSGPLHGIPLAVKDIIDVKGQITSAGCDALHDNVAQVDATVVRRLREAGMVLAGKTQTVQFAMGAPGINHQHGTPHNPWAKEHHVPGGSSNGSAVAVAAGLVPAALGTDTGGSVRIPAALCGTVGLKTTVGQVSRAGVFPLSETFDSVGPLTRSVEDSALLFQYMRGVDPLDRSTRHAGEADVMTRLKNGVRGMRIGLARSFFFDEATGEVRKSVEDAAQVLACLGANVDEFELPEASQVPEANPRRVISSVEGCQAHERILGPNFGGYDHALAMRIRDGHNASGMDYASARRACRQLAESASERLSDIDAFLAPTTPYPAMPLSQVDKDPETYGEWNRLFARHTSVGNVLGLCALTVPCGFSAQGLPLGLMIHAKSNEESTALRVGFAFEQATQWHTQRPSIG